MGFKNARRRFAMHHRDVGHGLVRRQAILQRRGSWACLPAVRNTTWSILRVSEDLRHPLAVGAVGQNGTLPSGGTHV